MSCRTPLATAFVEAGVEMGYENRDGNGEFQTGFMIPQGTIRRGSRYLIARVAKPKAELLQALFRFGTEPNIFMIFHCTCSFSGAPLPRHSYAL